MKSSGPTSHQEISLGSRDPLMSSMEFVKRFVSKACFSREVA